MKQTPDDAIRRFPAPAAPTPRSVAHGQHRNNCFSRRRPIGPRSAKVAALECMPLRDARNPQTASAVQARAPMTSQDVQSRGLIVAPLVLGQFVAWAGFTGLRVSGRATSMRNRSAPSNNLRMKR